MAQSDLLQLTSEIPAPARPIFVPNDRALPGQEKFPADLAMFMRVYGSGYFEIDGGLFLEVLNPWSEDYSDKIERDLNTIERICTTASPKSVGVALDPRRLKLWGYGEDRKHFFWLTDGPPAEWTVIAAYDLELLSSFKMPMLKFVTRLLCGALDCDFIGGVDTEDNCIDPAECRFVAAVTPS